ncbi:hypothetical protein PAECIP111893_02749 [Paenibacillus plantiphilus]|uniref:Uncharacterized protein n=2 Tax=Paenibacillus plantiphilus TaxID=2905650 RepID=A0ABM9CAP5_9BACL|nr:hypothetical protein PAECIP111893_02749 [Paenibacillus plantiphilus]
MNFSGIKPLRAHIKELSTSEQRMIRRTKLEKYGKLLHSTSHIMFVRNEEYVPTELDKIYDYMNYANKQTKQANITTIQKYLKDEIGIYEGQITGSYNLKFLVATYTFQQAAFSQDPKGILDLAGQKAKQGKGFTLI